MRVQSSNGALLTLTVRSSRVISYCLSTHCVAANKRLQPTLGNPRAAEAIRLAVKSRMIVNHLSKKMGMGRLPVFESLNRGEMAQGPLRNVVIVQGDIAVQSGFQIGRGVGAMGLQHLLDAAVEAFH